MNMCVLERVARERELSGLRFSLSSEGRKEVVMGIRWDVVYVLRMDVRFEVQGSKVSSVSTSTGSYTHTYMYMYHHCSHCTHSIYMYLFLCPKAAGLNGGCREGVQEGG